jgi:type IV pilus assembly protein PilY1
VSGTVSDTGCTTGLSGIGQTWSAPKTLFAAGYGSAPLLIMGGGYDTCEDTEPHTCTAASKGNKVYVLDANTGALLNTLSTERGVIADVAVVPDLTTGQALFAYVVDLGGNVYRVDIGSSAPAAWSMTKIAALGCDTTSACALNRKFMFAPDITLDSGTYMLLFGSGDREKPRNYSNPVNNYFFMLKDRPGDATWLSLEASRCGSAIMCLASLTPILSAANPLASL